MNKDRFLAVFEVNRVRKAPNENPAEGVKPNRIMERVCGDRCVGALQATQELVTQPKLLCFIPVIGISDVGDRFRQQNDSARHGQIGCASWPRSTVRLKKDWP